MHDLVIDVGNSFTKLALFAGTEIVRFQRLEHVGFNEFTLFTDGTELRSIAYASVGINDDELIQHLHDAAPVTRISAMSKLPISTSYETTNTLGVDRIANAVGVYAKAEGRPGLAIDTGTCITYDLVSHDGVHVGGAISPGIRLRARAMNQYSANLPFVLPDGPTAWAGLNTEQSLKSGIFNGIVAEMEGFIDRFRTEYPDLYVCIAGGDALTFQQVIKNPIFADPLLTIKGIHEILLFQ
jgi:type III pantothenate kinase